MVFVFVVHFAEPVLCSYRSSIIKQRTKHCFCSFLGKPPNNTTSNTDKAASENAFRFHMSCWLDSCCASSAQTPSGTTQQRLHKTVFYAVSCKAATNQAETEHLQMTLFCAKSRKVGPKRCVRVCMRICTYIHIYIYMYV